MALPRYFKSILYLPGLYYTLKVSEDDSGPGFFRGCGRTILPEVVSMDEKWFRVKRRAMRTSRSFRKLEGRFFFLELGRLFINPVCRYEDFISEQR